MSEIKIPEGYKQTEVGVIPEDWKVKDIGETLKSNMVRIRNKLKVLTVNIQYLVLAGKWDGQTIFYTTNLQY